MPETASTIVIRAHQHEGQFWYSAAALVGHNMLGEGIWRTVVLHTPNRRVAARELRERWGVRVPFRTVRWRDPEVRCPARGDEKVWLVSTTMALFHEVR